MKKTKFLLIGSFTAKGIISVFWIRIIIEDIFVNRLAVVITGKQIYVFEFKLAGSGTAEDALQQIDDKGYLLPYTAGARQLVKVGAEFDSATRTLGRWITG
jgi:hypothetical protein